MIDFTDPVVRPACGDSYQKRLDCWQQQLRESGHVAAWYKRDTRQRRWLP